MMYRSIIRIHLPGRLDEIGVLTQIPRSQMLFCRIPKLPERQEMLGATNSTPTRLPPQRSGCRNRFVIGFQPWFTPNGGHRFENINGSAGAQTAHFDSLATNYGIYVENQFDVRPSFTLVTGARVDWALRRFTDFFLANGDQSDERTFKAVSPKFGFVWRPRDEMQVVANVGFRYRFGGK
jgi:outer membrane receptor protein involved in Fe transport